MMDDWNIGRQLRLRLGDTGKIVKPQPADLLEAARKTLVVGTYLLTRFAVVVDLAERKAVEKRSCGLDSPALPEESTPLAVE
jgi:hypothetical protein